MAFRSPYRGEDSIVRLSPRAREIVSRTVMLVVALTLIVLSVRGILSLYAMHSAAVAQAAQQAGPGHPPSRTWVPVMPWLILIGMALIGALTLAAAVLPVAAMQALFERWNRPPVTGDRGLDGDDARRWWWWS